MIDIIVWYLWAQVFAMSGWVVASRWLRRLPDRGYGISKALGMLLGGFVYWMIVSLGLSRNDPGAVILALLLVVGIGLALRAYKSTQEVAPLVENRTDNLLAVVVTVEVLFALSFIGCAIYRSYNPEITYAGGEKFMESMFLNAIVRSPTFPPNDAWLSGFSISYYYFGYIILAMLTKISGIATSIAFNLGGALIFALTMTSAFSVGYNLWMTYRRQRNIGTPAVMSALAAGLLTATLLGVMGNQGGLMESIRCTRILPQSFWTWLDVRQLASDPVTCDGIIPTRFYWWWDWSRVVHDYTPTGDNQEVITESPAFSFILGDNHPHVMSLAYVLLALTLALHFVSQPGISVVEPERKATLDGYPILRWLSLHAGDLLLTSVVLGGLSFMNTWDFPIHGSLVVGAILLRRRIDGSSPLPGIIFGFLAFILGYIFYLPFYVNFASQARGIGINLFNGTRFAQFFLMFAPFLVAIVFYVGGMVRRSDIPIRRVLAASAGLLLAGVVLILTGMVVLGMLSAQGRGYFAELNSQGTVMGVSRDTVTQRLIGRVLDPWVPLFLLSIAAVCILLLLRPSRVATGNDIWRVSTYPFVTMLILAGAILTASVEFIFLMDLFGTRMNTVFKFYYQAWTLWSVAGAFALMLLVSTPHILARVGAGIIGVLILSGLLYPLYAALTKTNFFSAQPTLDGSAYLKQSNPDDVSMIDWLNQHVPGDPVILEAPAAHYGAYSYNGRISTFTGLPTLLGWGGHEHQWRGNYDEPARREPLIESLYNTTDYAKATEILRQFNVQYVIVGQAERAQYASDGLAKFSELCNIAYETGNSAIYQCNK